MTGAPAPAPAFAGFGPGLAAFFADLAEHQDRAWFQAHKGAYEDEVLAPLRALLMDLNDRLRAAGVPLAADPKRSISRIHRDVRFSKDKRPYKTYVSAAFTRGPGEMSPGLAYLHFDPREPFIGAGFYALEPPELAAFREAIARDPEGWLAVEAGLDAAGHPIDREDALKRRPKGYEALPDGPAAEALRLRHFVTKLRLAPSDLVAPDLAPRIAGFVGEAHELLQFGWRALGTPA